MSSSLNELAVILKEEAGLYRGLLEALDRERQALQGARLDGLSSAVAEKQALTIRLQAVEERREAAVEKLARERGCRPQEVSLGALARTAPEPMGRELEDRRHELKTLITRMRAENRRSEALCRSAGAMLGGALATLTGLAARGSVYRRGGRLEGARLNGKLVCSDI
jgi:flagellar biosynthesis/type III secretory pathway chaperone